MKKTIGKTRSGKWSGYAPHMSLDKFHKELSGCEHVNARLEPAFGEKNVAVCIVSSDEYAPFAAVVVQSIICNATPENNYDIVVMTDDMALSNRWRIESLANGRKNVSVRIADITDLIKGYSFYTWGNFTPNTYYRLLTPDLFSAYDKVVYLDSDIAVNHDIAELYDIDLGDCFIGAAYDTHVVSYCTQEPPLDQREYNIRTLKLDKPEVYFQMGVSLYNVKAFRENYEPGYLIKCATHQKLRWLDQDLINLLFKGKIKRLPNVWNVMVANIPEYIDEYYLPEDIRKEYYEARRNPYIVHYVGRAIPCYTSTPDLYEYFWKYARFTPFYEVLLHRMVANYAEFVGNRVSGQMYRSYLKTAIERVRKILMPIINMIFPHGSRHRASAAFVYRKLLQF